MPSTSELLEYYHYYFSTYEDGSKLAMSSLQWREWGKWDSCAHLLIWSHCLAVPIPLGWLDRREKNSINALDVEGMWGLDLSLSPDLCKQSCWDCGTCEQDKLLVLFSTIRVYKQKTVDSCFIPLKVRTNTLSMALRAERAEKGTMNWSKEESNLLSTITALSAMRFFSCH